MIRVLVTLLALLILGCAHAPPQGSYRVRSVAWNGVNVLDERVLSGVTRTKESDWRFWQQPPPIAEADLQDDANRVSRFYRRRGYYSAQVRSRLEGDPGRARAIFDIEEGEPVRVEERQIELVFPPGLPDALATQAKVPKDLPGGVGKIFDLDEYASAKTILLRELTNQGFPAAQLDGGAEVDAASATAIVEWQVATGPHVRIGEVQIDGLERVDRRLIDREIAFEPGDPLKPETLEQTQRDLVDLNLFRSVVVQSKSPKQLTTEAEQVWPVEIRIAERPPRTISAAAGFATADRARGRLAWEHRDLFRGAQTLEIAARHSYLQTSLESSVTWPHFRSRENTGEISLSLGQDRQEAFDADRVESWLGVSRGLSDRWTLRFGHAFDWSRTDDVSAATQQVLDNPEQSLFLSLARLELTGRATDDPLNPTEGWRADLVTDLSSGVLGSQVDFARVLAELRFYRPFYGAVVAARLETGVIQPFGRSDEAEIPLTQRFFAGGGDSVRGFKFQELGPLDSERDPIGGTSMLVANLEGRVPLWRELWGALFIDGGQVQLEPFQFSPDDMLYSTGAGIRYMTPVGPIRIDFGYLLNAPTDFDRTRIHISVGHSF